MDIGENKVWLLQSRNNPLPAFGTLMLDDGRISFSLDDEVDEAALEWLERELGSERLAARLAAGEPVVVFDYPLEDCAVTWPITGGGAVMIVRAPGRKWVISYDPPSSATFTSPMGLISGRRRARAWKRALAESGA